MVKKILKIKNVFVLIFYLFNDVIVFRYFVWILGIFNVLIYILIFVLNFKLYIWKVIYYFLNWDCNLWCKDFKENGCWKFFFFD